MGKKHIIFTVTNDLVYDQRMQRICGSLCEAGFYCTLVGRKRSGSKALVDHPFEQVRLNCWFDKGKLFYLEYNLRLLFYLLFHSADAYCAIDIDTALPVYLAAGIKRRPFILDAHEYFSQLEEVVTRPTVHWVWKTAERFVMRRFDIGYTISEGYAQLFKERYGVEMSVIRNVPVKQELPSDQTHENYVIYQGALNIGRGLEASILAMRSIEGLELRIFGEGPIRNELEELISQHDLHNRVKLCGGVEPEALRSYTRKAFAGLTLFSDRGLHHQYSLANRFFDYFHAGIPQIAIDHPEYRAFNDHYHIAELIDEATPQHIAKAMQSLQADEEKVEAIRTNCSRAMDENNWQNESKKLIQIYERI